jgi:hypothetical protein
MATKQTPTVDEAFKKWSLNTKRTKKQVRQWELYSSLGSVTCLHGYINRAQQMVGKVDIGLLATNNFNTACNRFKNALEKAEDMLRVEMRNIK